MKTQAGLFEELLETFRTHGGVADNVRYGESRHGHGLFPVDAHLAVRLHVSETLLVPAADLELREDRLAVREASLLPLEVRELFERLHRHFGWSAGLSEELLAAQERWNRLPSEVARFLTNLGTFTDPASRFAEPSARSCLYDFLRSRELAYKGGTYVAPVLEFVNHSVAAAPFVVASGVGVCGTFPGEIVARYSPADPWGYAMTYGFADGSPNAYCLPITVEPPGAPRLSIRRDLATADLDERHVRLPRTTIRSDAIDLSFVMLGHARRPDLPRGVFRKVMSPHLTIQKSDEIFDNILRFNHLRFLELLKILRKHDVPLTRMLEDAAIHQLEALSANVGARAL